MSDPEKQPMIPALAHKTGGATAKEWLGTLFAFGASAFFIAIGLTQFNDCNVEPYMPLALIASGGLFILISLIEIGEEYICPDGGCRKFSKTLITILWLGKLAVFGFFVYMVYRTHDLVVYSDATQAEYCSPWVYLTAMMSVVVTLTTIVVAYAIVPLVEKCCTKKE